MRGGHFHDALEVDRMWMGTVLALIAQLYRVEKMAREREVSGEARRMMRDQGARPALKQLHTYLLRIREELLPKSVAGQAVSHALNHRAALTRYCDDGDLEIDNNAPSGYCAGSRWVGITGRSSEATTGGRPLRCCERSCLPAKA